MRSLKLRIYSKPDCHLCHEALNLIRSAGAAYPLEIETINIEEDPQAYELYKYEIPVGFLEGRKLFKYRIDAKTLTRALDAELRRIHHEDSKSTKIHEE